MSLSIRFSFLLILLGRVGVGHGLMCYVCGPKTSKDADGDCKSMFQYDCNPTTLHLGDYDGKIYCKATRLENTDGTYSFSKECITSETLQSITAEYSQSRCHDLGNTTFCFCSTDLCNELSVARQFAAKGFSRTSADFPVEPLSGTGSQRPVAEFNVNANLDYYNGQQFGVPQDVAFQNPSENHAVSGIEQRPSGHEFQPSPINNKQLIQILPGFTGGATFQTNPPYQHSAVPPDSQSWPVPTFGQRPTGPTDIPQYIDPSLLLPLNTDPREPIIAVDHEATPQHVAAQPPPIASQGDEHTLRQPHNFGEERDMLPPTAKVPFSTQQDGTPTRFHNYTSVDAFIDQTAFRRDPLICMVCTENSVSPDGQCQNFDTTHCKVPNVQDPSHLRCLTRKTMLADGNSALEKFCVDITDLAAEYGPRINISHPQACYSAAGGLVQFCLCSHSQCNANSMNDQMTLAHGIIDIDFVDQVEPAKLQGANHCKRCTRSNMNEPSECESLHDFDCSQQYRNKTVVYCLTRMIKNASGLYSIERRCVSKDDHDKAYPGSEIVHNGCGQAWNGHVQYCVCPSNNCNAASLSDQQAAVGYKPIVTDDPATAQPPQPHPEPEPNIPLPPARPSTPHSLPEPGYPEPGVPEPASPTPVQRIEVDSTQPPFWKRRNGGTHASAGVLVFLSVLALLL